MTSYLESVHFVSHVPPTPQYLLVAIHGLTGSSDSVAPYLSEIYSESIATLAPDLRGHGKTLWEGETGDFTPEVIAAEVESLIRAFNQNNLPVILCGVSLGATVALRISARNTVGAIGAVFFRPSHDVSRASHLQINIDIANLIESSASAEELLEVLRKNPRYQEIAAGSASDGRALLEKALGSCSSGRVQRLREGSLWIIPPEWFESVRIPVSIIGCVDDYLHPISVATSWNKRCVASSLATLPPKDDREGEWSHLAALTLRDKVMDLMGGRKG